MASSASPLAPVSAPQLGYSAQQPACSAPALAAATSLAPLASAPAAAVALVPLVSAARPFPYLQLKRPSPVSPHR